MPHDPLLLTRPEAASRRFGAAVADRLGPGPVVISPLLKIVPLGPVPSLAGCAGVVLTSENALLRRGADWPAGLPAYCVGRRTAAAAAAAGFVAHSAEGALPELVALLRGAPVGGRLMYLRGRHVSGDVAAALSQHGLLIDEAVVYDQLPQPLSAQACNLLASPGPVVIPVFSPRSAQALAVALKNAAASLRIAAISPAVKAALPVHSGATIVVAARPNAEAMIDRIASLQSGQGA